MVNDDQVKEEEVVVGRDEGWSMGDIKSTPAGEGLKL